MTEANKKYRFSLPEYVLTGINLLNEAGYEAYLVGGAVRDLLSGKTPADYDLATSATPDEMRTVFKGFRTIDTGIAHGTLTVRIGEESLEITTYRIDGDYTDARHPDCVRFTRSLHEDVARRDFSIGAMAYHPREGLYDFFGGEADMKAGILRTVGTSEKRFREDALRILRALRFASRLGFTPEAETAKAMHMLAPQLLQIAPERIREECIKILCGKHAASVLREFYDVLAVVLPEISPLVGFLQHNAHHDYDVWEHTLHALDCAPADKVIRLAVFFHDFGKPACFFKDAEGVGHFYGHAERSAAITDSVMRRLRFDNETRERVVLLVRYHDVLPMPKTRQFARLRSRFGDAFLGEWLAVIRADRMGQKAHFSDEAEAVLKVAEEEARLLLQKEERLSISSLAIDGNDLIAIGLRGKAIGEALSRALDAVLAGKTENEKEALIMLIQGKEPAPIECERKFLIRYPDTALLSSLGAEASEITQTYLLSPKGVTSRVRKRVFPARTVYTHTEKVRLTAMSAEERENEITQAKYDAYLAGADPSAHPVHKTRYTLPYKGHLLEIDVYPFWKKQAILEIELTDENEELHIPEFITVLREVTADIAYKNARLARHIPDEE